MSGFHETENDRQAEREFQKYAQCRYDTLLGPHKALVAKMPFAAACDFRVQVDGGVIEFIEFKKRGFHWGEFPSVFLSCKKVSKLIELGETKATSVLFIIEDRTGSRYWTKVDRRLLKLTVKRGGRSANPRDSRDLHDDVYLIPNDEFTECEPCTPSA